MAATDINIDCLNCAKTFQTSEFKTEGDEFKCPHCGNIHWPEFDDGKWWPMNLKTADEMSMSKWQVTTDPKILRRMGKTGEELGELTNVVNRIVIQGIDEVDPGTGKKNRVRLEEEIADVFAQLDVNCGMLNLDVDFIMDRRDQKVQKMRAWEGLYNAVPVALSDSETLKKLSGN